MSEKFILKKEMTGCTSLAILNPELLHQISPNLHTVSQGTLPWKPILGSKLAKSDYSPLFVALAFQNRLQYRCSDFKKFICDDLTILCVNLVKFGAVTLGLILPKMYILSFLCLKYTFQTNYLKIHQTDFHQIFIIW